MSSNFDFDEYTPTATCCPAGTGGFCSGRCCDGDTSVCVEDFDYFIFDYSFFPGDGAVVEQCCALIVANALNCVHHHLRPRAGFDIASVGDGPTSPAAGVFRLCTI